MPAALPSRVLEHGVIAKMRVAVDHAVMAERVPPGAEHGAGDLVALFERPVAIVEQALAVEPGHGEQPLGGQLERRTSGTRMSGSSSKMSP